MKLDELINNYLSKELYGQFWNNWQNHHENTPGSIAPWLWIFLFLTVILALVICLSTTLIAISKTKKKVKDFQEKQTNNMIQKEFNYEKEENIDLFSSFEKNDENNQEIILKKLFKNLQDEATTKNLLDFQLIDIKEIKIDIINYLSKSKVKTINDLFLLNEKEKTKLVLNFPNMDSKTIDQKGENFIYFLDQIQNFIKNKKEK